MRLLTRPLASRHAIAAFPSRRPFRRLPALANPSSPSPRTDPTVRQRYPSPATALHDPSDASGTSSHPRRALPSFSLEGRSVVVTGAARGLGLVMGRGIVDSGADLAIVDLNS
jgi:D-arabinitol 2-dehydrogenase